jgi:hypothetical protein
MLIKIADEWVDVADLDLTYDRHPDEPGNGAVVTYRGEPGFVCLTDLEDRPVLVSSRRVAVLREARGGTELETMRGHKVAVRGAAGWIAGIVNHARLRAV